MKINFQQKNSLIYSNNNKLIPTLEWFDLIQKVLKDNFEDIGPKKFDDYKSTNVLPIIEINYFVILG